jgi:hypothetical protein
MLEALMIAGRSSANDSPTVSREEVRRLFDRGDEGERVYVLAIMQASEQLRDSTLIRTAIADPRSAFEQYQALVLAEMMVGELDAEELELLRQVVMTERETGGRIAPGGDRWDLTERVLAALARRSDELRRRGPAPRG